MVISYGSAVLGARVPLFELEDTGRKRFFVREGIVTSRSQVQGTKKGSEVTEKTVNPQYSCGLKGHVSTFSEEGGRSRSRSRSRSPPRERRRSRSASRERTKAPERSQCREKDRKRSRLQSPHRKRSKSPRRHRSTSPSPSQGKERRDEEQKETKSEEQQITEEDSEGKTEEEMEMMKVMGFTAFDSTKGKRLDGNVNAYVINVSQKRKYRESERERGRGSD
ncbi:U4/U6.U5 small nuclear ribonucleoprotein 27 kDa protein-like, partial [Molossus molossus]|uniref:U4/U6.U5 small nuclear ribonucleoprotein 27 kDa protein-like n=1 Tax=Molossus molossus TaxID=27622 RepID=UPI0017467371